MSKKGMSKKGTQLMRQRVASPFLLPYSLARLASQSRDMS
jgi:hypothetical protein